MEAGGEFGGDANFPTSTCEGCGARWARALWQLEGGRRVRRGASVVLEGPAGGSKISRSLGGSYDTGMEAAARAVAGQGGRWSSAGGGFGSSAVALKVHLVTAARRSLGSRSRMGQWPCAMASVEGGVAGKRVRSERRGERRAQRGRLGGTGGVECARWATGAALSKRCTQRT